jgi:hypothetical protein
VIGLSQDAVAATTLPAGVGAGDPPINFRAHEVRANPQGARQDFEEMVGQLVRAVRPGVAAMVAANPGDWGLDVFIGDLGGQIVVWQSKYFMPQVGGNTHQAQIRESFNSAIKHASSEKFAVQQWVLCVPSSMDAPMSKWWAGWKKRNEKEHGVLIELWDENELRGLLLSPDADAVRKHYYGPPRPERTVAQVVALADKDSARWTQRCSCVSSGRQAMWRSPRPSISSSTPK